jgi:hypothetical protein
MSFLVNPYWYVSAGGCTDADANAFLTAAGITDPTITSAICTLVTSMKANGTWAKCIAIYPFVGGTAATHKFNLKNPLDTDAAFRLSFVGGWTHSANGALPGGVNSYADTFYNLLSSATQNSHHISYYSRTDSNTTEIEFGAADGPDNSGATSRSFIEIRTSNVSYFTINNGALTNFIQFSDTNSRGYYVGNRTAINVLNAWKNGVKNASSAFIVSLLPPNRKYYLGAYNSNNSPAYYSKKQCAFATIGSGLTDAEAATLYTDVQAFNTTLSRQV